MKRKLFTTIVLVYSLTLTSLAQITLLGSFNPTEISSLCGIGYRPDSSQVWIYSCSNSSIHCYTTSGTLIRSFAIAGGTANDVDVEMAPKDLQIDATTVSEGQLFFINGESGVAEIYAMNNVTGAVIETLATAFGASHVVGAAYHPIRGTFFMLQDKNGPTGFANMIAEIDPLTGGIIQSFLIASFFSVNFGDIEVGANGNLYVVSSTEDSIAEVTPTGTLVKKHDLPTGVSSLSGIAIDCSADEAWVSSTGGTVYHLAQFPGGDPLTPTISADGPVTFCKGEDVTFTATAPGALTYQWQKGSNPIAGATDPTYTTTKAGKYSVIASDACESFTSNKKTVTVNPKPESDFTQGTCTGGTVLLTRTGTPTTDVTYKWKLNNSNISGATNSTYLATVSGSYKVEVTITSTGCKKTSPAQTVTTTCKVENAASELSAEAYPNPFTNVITLNIQSASSEPVNVSLSDSYGGVIRTWTDVDPSSPFEISEALSAGVYFVDLKTENGVGSTIKIVKAH